MTGDGVTGSAENSGFDPIDLNDHPAWVLDYLNGASLRQVAQILGHSHQTVANQLRDRGVTREYVDAYRRYRDSIAVAQQGPAIRAEFLKLKSLPEIADSCAVTQAVVVAYLDSQWSDWRVLYTTGSHAPKRYTSNELTQCLWDAAAATVGVLSTNAYDDYLAGHPNLDDQRPRPGKQAMMLRFGSWNAALRDAGLPTNPKSGPARRYDDPVAMLMLLVRCWDDIGKPPTVADYEEWQREHADAPSSTIARRLLESWPTARIRAWQIRHGVSLDPQAGVAVPPELHGQRSPSLPTRDGDTTIDVEHGAYRRADEATVLATSTEWVVYSGAERERALQSHARLQNAIADAVTSRNLEPLSPASTDPQFDLAFQRGDGVLVVVEVKSCTDANREVQSRLGLGQVLQYSHQLRAQHEHVVAVLATELPLGTDWLDLLAGLDVHVIHEAQIQNGLEAILKALGPNLS